MGRRALSTHSIYSLTLFFYIQIIYINIYKLQRESKGCIFSSSSPRFLSCFFFLVFFFTRAFSFAVLFYYTIHSAKLFERSNYVRAKVGPVSIIFPFSLSRATFKMADVIFLFFFVSESLRSGSFYRLKWCFQRSSPLVLFFPRFHVSTFSLSSLSVRHI